VTPPTTTAPGGSPEAGGGGAGQAGGQVPGAPAPIGGSGPKRVAKARPHDGHKLLTTTKGRTLYSLSIERHGKFTCTEMSGCTSIWLPLTVESGVVPKGPVKLGTVRRPEGTLQVTYRGLPLYTFAADKKPGQVKGEGLKDVGTWHAAAVPKHAHP
jgi:predicted lipoprotein with Yx(FWY)xxD motif